MFRNYRLVETNLTWPAEGQLDESRVVVTPRGYGNATDEILTIVATLARLDVKGVLKPLTVRRETTVEAASSNGWRFPRVERISANVLRILAGDDDVYFNLDANISVDAGGRRRRSYIERNSVTLEEVFCKWIDFTMCQFMTSG